LTWEQGTSKEDYEYEMKIRRMVAVPDSCPDTARRMRKQFIDTVRTARDNLY
jgi:hypothetical protein